MGFHTFDPAGADRLEDPTRFRFCSREELLQHLPRDGPVLDIGSGTGYYTDELAPFLDSIYALDVQPAMHRRYRERGVPANVALVAADASALPVADASLSGAFSTMTYHESVSDPSIRELDRVLAADAPVVIVDWSGEGSGERGPPLSERHDAAHARETLADAGFHIDHAAERSETFHLVARAR